LARLPAAGEVGGWRVGALRGVRCVFVTATFVNKVPEWIASSRSPDQVRPIAETWSGAAT